MMDPGGEAQYSTKKRNKSWEQKGDNKILRIISNLIYLTTVNRNYNEIAEWCFHFSF